ncbi:MAG: hypothetical protein ACU84J_13055 [Gammaproteobacteria bacterium]
MANCHLNVSVDLSSMLRVLKSSVLIALLAVSAFVDCKAENVDMPALSYVWGRGLSVVPARLNFGGYVHASLAKAESEAAHVTLDDISLFISWSPFDRLHFFSEIELEDFISTREIPTLNRSLSLERYYFDYFVTDSTQIRVGKFLTPVGIWNINHAAPLVWTTTRPLITEDEVFSSHATGVMVSKLFLLSDFDMNWSLYADDSDDLEPRKNHFHDFDNALGSRFQFSIDESLKLGASYLTYKKRADFHQSRDHLFGIDAFWEHRGYQLQFEFLYRFAPRNNSEHGFYLQGIAPLGNRWYAVGRYEYLDGVHLHDTSASDVVTHIGVAGLAWRPYAPLVLKGEYRFGHDNETLAPSGFYTSISMFF